MGSEGIFSEYRVSLSSEALNSSKLSSLVGQVVCGDAVCSAIHFSTYLSGVKPLASAWEAISSGMMNVICMVQTQQA